MRTLVLASLALIASACAAPTAPPSAPAPATTVPAAPAPPTPVAPTPLPVLPTATAVRVAAAAPTVAPTPAPEPKIAAPQPRGTAIWRDDTLRNDAMFVSIEDLPDGQSYSAWLLGADGELLLGQLTSGAASAKVLTFIASEQQNLLAEFDRVSIGRSANEPLLSGSLPEKALLHVRHILAGIAVTPKGIGFGIGLRQETEEMLRHAQFLSEAMDEGNLPLEKLHAEHLVNLIEGAEGEHYGDLNGNGKVDNPGDGFGVLPNGAQDGYVKGMRDHAQLACAASDATDEIKLHAGHVQIAGDNTRLRTTELRDRALSILGKRSVADTRVEVQKILGLAHQTIQGVDLNGDEQVAPVPGEGGTSVAYQHAQLMAAIPLRRPATATQAQAQPTPQPQPTAHVHAAPPAPVVPSTVRIAIGDDTFTPKSMTVAKGTVVSWSQAGQRPHTVTADDESFDSQIMRSGASFEHTFSEAGIYLYYCTLHGGPGGAGMAAEIKVEG